MSVKNIFINTAPKSPKGDFLIHRNLSNPLQGEGGDKAFDTSLLKRRDAQSGRLYNN